MNTTVRAQPLQPPRFDLHRSGPGQPSGPSPNPSQPTDDDIKQRASEIVNTGRGGFLGFGADPDARMQALAQRSQGLSAESRQRLVSEVIAQEPGSANNWLTADRLNRLTDSSRMSDADRQAVKEGVAGAYVAGDISYAQMQALMGVTMQFAPAVHVQQFQAARGFLSGDSPALSAARLQYTAHSFNRTGERASLGLGFGIDLDNALALTFMADAGEQAAAAQAFARLDPDTQRAVAAQVGAASIGYHNSRSAIADLPDPLATLTNAVRAEHPATTTEGRLLLTRMAQGLASSSHAAPELQPTATALYAEVAQGRSQQLAEDPAAHTESLARVASAEAEAARVLQTLPPDASAQQIWEAYQANPDALTAPTFTQYLEMRGDHARQLSGAALRNDIGLAMGLAVSRAPDNDAEERDMGRGEFDFFDGDAGNVVRTIEAQILNTGGEGARIAALPVTVASQEHGLIQTTVWRVETADGREHFVDYNPGTGEARSYTSFDDWLRNNKLPPGEMTYARNGHLTAGADGRPQLDRANTPSTVDTAWEAWVKPTLDGAAMVGGVVLLGAAVVGTGGTALLVGGALLGAYGVGTGGAEVLDRATHGQSLGLGNAQARNAWLNLGAGALSLGAMGSSLRLANAAGRMGGGTDDVAQLARMGQTSRGLNIAAQYADTAAMADTGLTLAANWDQLTPTERTQALAMMAFWSAGAGISARQAGGIHNLYGTADFSSAIRKTSQWINSQLPTGFTGVRVLSQQQSAPIALEPGQAIANLSTPEGTTLKIVVQSDLPNPASALLTPRLSNSQALEHWRAQVGIPAGRDTIAIGNTDVPGLQDISFHGASAIPRRLSDPPMGPRPEGPIQSPSDVAQFSNHAEQDIFNHFVNAAQTQGITSEHMRGKTLDITISNESGVCNMCKSGLGNPDKPSGIVKQLSEMYPDLLIRIWSPGSDQPLQVLNGVKVQ